MDITEIIEFYRSLDPSNLSQETEIINKASEEGVIPSSLRYGIMKDVYRGIIKSVTDDIFYFHYKPDGIFSLVKANTEDQKWEANRILTKSELGCDLIKAGEGSGNEVPGLPSVMEEEEFVDNQDDITTDRHPGAATGFTPDRPEVGRQWHQEEAIKSTGFWTEKDLLDGLNVALKKSVEEIKRPISESEARFMSEVLGKTPEEIDIGVNLNPTQKVLYQRWLGKSMRSKISPLKNWLNGKR